MAKEITDNDLIGAQTLANITQRAQERGLDVRRDDVRFVLEVVSEADPWFEQGASANLFAGRFRNFVVARCRGQGLNLSADELDLIDAWFAGGTLPQQLAARAPRLRPPQAPTRAGAAEQPRRCSAAQPRRPPGLALVVPRRRPPAAGAGDGPRRTRGAARGEGEDFPAHRPHPPAQLMSAWFPLNSARITHQAGCPSPYSLPCPASKAADESAGRHAVAESLPSPHRFRLEGDL